MKSIKTLINSGWYRLLILLSTLWTFGTSIALEPWHRASNQDEFLLIGVFPIIIIWGLLWVWSGFKNNK